MLGAEKRTGSGKQAATARISEPATGASIPPSGRWFVRTGCEAVNATEKLICGNATVGSPSVAEGLAVSGRRAATLLERNRSVVPLVVEPTTRVGWVHHRMRPEQPRPRGRLSFELVAANAQEAVDHCLVAHRIASRLGMPGVCTVDSVVAEELHLVRLPGDDALDALSRPADGEPGGVEGAVREALESVAVATDRPLAAVSTHRMSGARFALVTSGVSAAPARRCAEMLRAAGIPTGAVNVTLVRPFPTEELRALFDGVETIAVIDSPRSVNDDESLVTELRAAIGEDGKRRIRPIGPAPGTDAELWTAIRNVLGLKPEGEPPAISGESDSTAQPISIGVMPDGPWSAELLFDTAALIGDVDGLSLARPQRAFEDTTALCIGRGAGVESDASGLDLLFVAHPSLLAGHEALDAARDGGTIVVHAEAPSPEAVWKSIPPRNRETITRRGLHLKWIDVTKLLDDAGATTEDVSLMLAGALLAADSSLGIRIGRERDLLSWKLGSEAPADGEEPESALLRKGGAALVELDPEVLAAAPEQEIDFVHLRKDVQMPAPAQAEPTAELRESLQRFHLAGEAAELLPALPLRPALLDALKREAPVWRDYPVVIDTEADATFETLEAIGFVTLLSRGVEKTQKAGDALSIIDKQLDALTRLAGHVVDERGGVMALTELFDESFARLTSELDLSDAGATTLKQELDALRPHLPSRGRALGYGERTLPLLHATAVRGEHARRMVEFNENVECLVQRLAELLEVDDSHGPKGTSAEAVGATLGANGERFLDPASLSTRLPQRGSKRLEPERRSRIERTLDTLRRHLDASDSAAEMHVVHAGLDVTEEDLPRARWIEHPDGLRAAIGLFDGVAASMLELFRAVRIAQLDVQGHYEPERHDRVLQRFGWEAFSAEELLLVPPVVVFETAERLRGSSLASFSELLRSGRPVQVLISGKVSELEAGKTWEALSGYHPGLGYVAVAHREAVVVQSTLGDPEHLFSGLRRIAAALRPAVALVTEPSSTAPVAPWLQLAAAHVGRATPCFRYDPDAGTSWAERFDLSDNPQPERAWPELELSYVDDADTEQQMSEVFTFAHAAALDPAYRQHLRLLPAGTSTDELVEIAAYLAAPESQRRQLLPFIWVVDANGALTRALMTRELAFATRDHARAWRILQELGGMDNEYARRAAQEAREQALAEVEEERKQLEAEHAEQLEQVRHTEAAAAMERLANVLLNVDELPLGQLAPAAPAALPPAAPAVPAVEEPPAEAAEAAVEEEEEPFVEEAYVNSVLCTTCQDCININPKMFKYNENKQAIITDRAAGTFEQLVKAAEKCPARCIHPGAPPADDPTVTDDLIARAKKFQ